MLHLRNCLQFKRGKTLKASSEEKILDCNDLLNKHDLSFEFRSCARLDVALVFLLFSLLLHRLRFSWQGISYKSLRSTNEKILYETFLFRLSYSSPSSKGGMLVKTSDDFLLCVRLRARVITTVNSQSILNFYRFTFFIFVPFLPFSTPQVRILFSAKSSSGEVNVPTELPWLFWRKLSFQSSQLILFMFSWI